MNIYTPTPDYLELLVDSLEKYTKETKEYDERIIAKCESKQQFLEKAKEIICKLRDN